MQSGHRDSLPPGKPVQVTQTPQGAGQVPVSASGARASHGYHSVPGLLPSIRVLRIQDADGRGPFKPGFSKKWIDDDGPPQPKPWTLEFPGLLKRMNDREAHYGCACRTVEQIREWFTPSELVRLHIFGYRLVSMTVDEVLAESRHQLVFKRLKPLREDIEIEALP